VQVRVMISDFAVFFAICVMVFVDFLVGLNTDKLEVPDKFEASRRSVMFMQLNNYFQLGIHRRI